MEVLRRRLIQRYGKHPCINQIIRDLTNILTRAEKAWEDMDRQAFSKACKELRDYKPPL